MWRCYKRNFKPLNRFRSRAYGAGRSHDGLCPEFLVFSDFPSNGLLFSVFCGWSVKVKRRVLYSKWDRILKVALADRNFEIWAT